MQDDAKFITPKHDLGDKPLRFNWQTPILLSQHNQDVLYFGANKLYRSLDKGDNWERISDDLTKGGKKGNVPYGTLTTIHESPFKFGLIYTGSDDGLIQISQKTVAILGSALLLRNEIPINSGRGCQTTFGSAACKRVATTKRRFMLR